MTKNTNTNMTVNVLGELNERLFLYKSLTIGLSVLAILQTMILSWQLNTNPIVIVKDGKEKSYHIGFKKKEVLTEEDIARFVERFILRRYSWKEFIPKAITGKLSCIVTENFLLKLKENLAKKKTAEGKTKVEQYAAFIRSTLQEGQALASFDRILRINGVPIISPVELSLSIVERQRTECNLTGLYVNGLKEFSKK